MEIVIPIKHYDNGQTNSLIIKLGQTFNPLIEIFFKLFIRFCIQTKRILNKYFIETIQANL